MGDSHRVFRYLSGGVDWFCFLAGERYALSTKKKKKEVAVAGC